MSWPPKRYDPPGRKRPEDEPERCPKCSWAEWETFAWLTVGTIVFYVTLIVFLYRR